MARQSVAVNETRTARTKLPLVEILLVLVLFVMFFGAPQGANSAIIWICLALQYGLIVAAVWRPIHIYRGLPTFISAEFFFLFFSYLIFYYPYQLHVLGIYDVSQSHYFPGRTFADESNQAILLCSIAMVSFRAGVRTLRPAVHTADESDRRIGRLDRVTCEDLAFPVFALQVALLGIYLASGWRAAGEGRYTDTTEGGSLADNVYLGITVLSMVAIALSVFPATKDAPSRSIVLRLSLVLACLWAVRILIAGDRNSFALLAIVGVGGLLTFRIRAGRWTLVFLCALALVLYLAIEQFRRTGDVAAIMSYFSGETVRGSAAADGDSSFNISTVSVRAALGSVPEQYDFGYGLYKLIGFAGIIPFVRGMVIGPDLAYKSSSDVLNSILLGPAASWGVGTNVIVDIFIDFGLLSVPIVLFMLGVAVAYVQNTVTRNPDSLWRATFYLMTLAFVAQLPRYALSFPARPLVWVVLLFSATALLAALQARTPSSASSRPGVRPKLTGPRG